MAGAAAASQAARRQLARGPADRTQRRTGKHHRAPSGTRIHARSRRQVAAATARGPVAARERSADLQADRRTPGTDLPSDPARPYARVQPAADAAEAG